MERFSGTVEAFASVPVQRVREWVTTIPFEDWPQQTPVDEQLRPAMVKDLEWHDFGATVRGIVDDTSSMCAGVRPTNILLTVVMPGHEITPHVDAQPEHWRARIHVPLTTNDESRFIVGGEHHHMEVGAAYLVNTTVEHSVRNDGSTPRIHLMWDLLS